MEVIEAQPFASFNKMIEMAKYLDEICCIVASTIASKR